MRGIKIGANRANQVSTKPQRTSCPKIAGIVLALFTATTCPAQNIDRPWLKPAEPTLLEYVILDLQANWSDPEFGENDMTIAFYAGPKSFEQGVIYCQIRYLPSAKAEIVQMTQQGIRRRFELDQQKHYPWAKLEFDSAVAGSDKRSD